jgi:hypothetical protein
MKIFTSGYWLKVVWIDAMSCAAKMIQVMAGRDGPDEAFIRNAVGVLG